MSASGLWWSRPVWPTMCVQRAEAHGTHCVFGLSVDMELQVCRAHEFWVWAGQRYLTS